MNEAKDIKQVTADFYVTLLMSLTPEEYKNSATVAAIAELYRVLSN